MQRMCLSSWKRVRLWHERVVAGKKTGSAVNMNKPILPLMLDEAPYAKSIRLDISDIDQIDFKNPIASSKKLITSLMYVLNK